MWKIFPNKSLGKGFNQNKSKDKSIFTLYGKSDSDLEIDLRSNFKVISKNK